MLSIPNEGEPWLSPLSEDLTGVYLSAACIAEGVDTAFDDAGDTPSPSPPLRLVLVSPDGGGSDPPAVAAVDAATAATAAANLLASASASLWLSPSKIFRRKDWKKPSSSMANPTPPPPSAFLPAAAASRIVPLQIEAPYGSAVSTALVLRRICLSPVSLS